MIALIVVWALCGVVAFGMTFADLGAEYRRWSIPTDDWADFMHALLVGLFGPIGLITATILYRGHGVRFW
jgi:hypothetical protein